MHMLALLFFISSLTGSVQLSLLHHVREQVTVIYLFSYDNRF